MKQSVTVLFVIILAGCLGQAESSAPDPYSRGFAAALLWPEVPHVSVEVDYVEGRAPSDRTLERLDQTLNAQATKRTVTIEDPTLIDVGDESRGRKWSYSDAIELSEQERNHDSDLDKAWIHILFLNGHGDTGWGGAYFGDGTIVLFNDYLEHVGVRIEHTPAGDIGPPNPFAAEAEAAVAIHELGHAMGLIDLGAPVTKLRSPAQDPNHSTNRESVMYGGVHDDATFLEEMLASPETGGRLSPDFDQDDLADLKALRDLYPGPVATG